MKKIILSAIATIATVSTLVPSTFASGEYFTEAMASKWNAETTNP